MSLNPGQKLKNGDKICLDESKLFMQPEKIDLPIIFEDKNVMVINKPAGVLTHSKGT
jgi:23S rRNA-/tRNA-specific pseudouridylate synthase